VNRIRKIGNWLWLNKERLVLAVMVCFLVLRVYQVVSPQEAGPTARPYPLPGKELPPDSPPPGLPPAPPPAPRTADWSQLWRYSIFNYRQPRVGTGPADRGDRQTVKLDVLRIRQMADGNYMAQIRTLRDKWYREGEAFETYEVLDIDPEAQTVTIFVEQEQKAMTFSVQP
jgi:hypothetical protein